MSADDIDATGQLKLDFESYLKGEEPPASELACAPLLESWRATLVKPKVEYGTLPTVFVLAGYASGHPLYTSARTNSHVAGDLARPPPQVGSHLESTLPARGPSGGRASCWYLAGKTIKVKITRVNGRSD